MLLIIIIVGGVVAQIKVTLLQNAAGALYKK